MPAETSEGRLTREELLAQKEILQQSLLSALDRIKDTSPRIDSQLATRMGMEFI